MDCCEQAYEEVFELIHEAEEYVILCRACDDGHENLARAYSDAIGSLISICGKLHEAIKEADCKHEHAFDENLYQRKMEKLRFGYSHLKSSQ